MLKDNFRILSSIIAISLIGIVAIGFYASSYEGGNPGVIVEGNVIISGGDLTDLAGAFGAVQPGKIYNVPISFNEGIMVDGVELISNSGAMTLSSTLSAGNIDVGTITAGVADQTASSTALDGTTLLESELMLGAFSITNTGDGGADGLFTITLPATSTLTTIIPNDGECLYDFRLYNLHATPASSTTVIAGTGMVIYESEDGDEIIAGLGVGRIDFCRKADTDVDVFISGYTTD